MNEFASKRTPLSRECVLDLAKTLFETLPKVRSSSLGFKENRPGKDWLFGFIIRHPELKLKTRAA